MVTTMWHDPARSASTYDTRAVAAVVGSTTPVPAASIVAPPSASCLPSEPATAVFAASSGYAAALRRLARQAESAGSRGGHADTTEPCQVESAVASHATTDQSNGSMALSFAVRHHGGLQTVNSGREGRPAAGSASKDRSAVAASSSLPTLEMNSSSASSADSSSNGLLYSHYPNVVAGLPLPYAYLRSAEDALRHGIGRDTGGAATFASAYAPYAGWPGAAAAADAVLAARMCLLQVMGYPEAVHQQLLLQQLLAQSMFSSGGGNASAAGISSLPTVALHREVPPFNTGQASAEEQQASAGTIKTELDSVTSEGPIGFRPYAATNSRKVQMKMARTHPSAETCLGLPSNPLAAIPSVPCEQLPGSGSQEVTETIRHTATQSKKAKMVIAQSLSHNGCAMPRATRLHKNGITSPDIPCKAAVQLDARGVKKEPELQTLDATGAIPDAAGQESKGRHTVSKLDLAEMRKRSRPACDSALSSDEEEDEARARERVQRSMLIRMPLPPSYVQDDSPEKLHHMAILGLVPVQEATSIRCSMASRRSALHGEPIVLLEDGNIEPALLLLGEPCGNHGATHGATKWLNCAEEASCIDKHDFLRCLDLVSVDPALQRSRQPNGTCMPARKEKAQPGTGLRSK